MKPGKQRTKKQDLAGMKATAQKDRMSASEVQKNQAG